MPVILNDLTKNVPIKVYSPKFFDSKLTGTGKKIGLLNEARNPIHIDKSQNTSNENINVYKHHYSNGQADVTFVPFYIITPDAWSYMTQFNRPSLQSLFLHNFSQKCRKNLRNSTIFCNFAALVLMR